MAEIILGIGTSHSPMLNLTARQWQHRAEVDRANKKLTLSDGRTLSYPELLAERGPMHRAQIDLSLMESREAASHQSLDLLGDALERAAPDVVVIVGDDQAELFSSDNQPAFAIFHGEELITTTGKYTKNSPDWMQQVGRGCLMDDIHRLPAAPSFARELIERLMDAEVDVTSVGGVKDPAQAGFGHAYGFIVKRLFRRSIPVVAVMLNTYFPPNVPSAGRCYDIGRKLRAAIDAISTDLKVAVIASGGLSHFVIDEELDRRVLEAFRTRDEKAIRAISRDALRSGSSEILNWILMAGATDHLSLQMAEYHPLYRTEAGTGVGAGFCYWAPQPLTD
jgi:hypothetical protein